MRVYGTVNAVLLGLLLYSAVFPFISPVMERIAPAVWRCQYRAATGRPCPFCGLSADMRRFLSTGSTEGSDNPAFGFLLTLFAGELILRAAFAWAFFRLKSPVLPLADAGIHIAAGVFLIYR